MSTPSPIDVAREFDLVPADNARLANLCGPLDENLRLVEERMNVSIKRRGATFRISGARADLEGEDGVLHQPVHPPPVLRFHEPLRE